MSEWTHPTLADTGVTGEVRCRCSRRKDPAEMLEVWFRGHKTHICVACTEDLLREGELDHLTFHRDAGAPEEWLAAFEAKLRAGPLLRSGLPQEMWGEMLADELNKDNPPQEI